MCFVYIMCPPYPHACRKRQPSGGPPILTTLWCLCARGNFLFENYTEKEQIALLAYL